MNAIWKFRNKVMLTSEPINPGSLTWQFQLDCQRFKRKNSKIWDSKQTLRLLQWERPPCSCWKANGNAFLVTCKTYTTIVVINHADGCLKAWVKSISSASSSD